MDDTVKHITSEKHKNTTDGGVLRFVSVESSKSENLLNYTINFEDNDTRSLRAHEVCLVLPSLGTLRLASEDFATLFTFPDVLLYPQPNIKIFVPDELVLLTHYDIFAAKDAGSTLKVQLQMVKDQTVSILYKNRSEPN